MKAPKLPKLPVTPNRYGAALPVKPMSAPKAVRQPSPGGRVANLGAFAHSPKGKR